VSDSIEVLRDRLKYVHEGQLLLLEITQRIASGGSLGAMLPDIVNATLRVAEADGIRAVIHDPTHSLAYSAGAAAGAMLKYDATIWQLVQANGQLQIDDLANTTDKSLEPLRELGGALIALPLMAQGTLQGVLWMTYAQHKSFNPDDVRFLSILAGQTAVAIANAYAFDATRRGRAQLAAVLNSSVDPILVIDEKSSIVLINPAAERAFALTATNVIGKPIAEVIHAEPILDLIKGVEDTEGVEWQTDNGQTYSLRISNMDNDAAHTSGRVIIMRDITRYRNLRDNQSEFVSTVSHDLRSPLTYMHGYATMMPMVGELNEKQRGFADKILSGIVQMTDLVDKILDASRLDPEGNYVLNREACDVTKIVSDVAGIHQQPAEKKKQITYSQSLTWMM
jgi:PAS domain S-box-containing protein